MKTFIKIILILSVLAGIGFLIESGRKKSNES